MKTQTYTNTFEIIAEPGDDPLLTMTLTEISELIGDAECEQTVLVEEGYRFSFATKLIKICAGLEVQTTASAVI